MLPAHLSRFDGLLDLIADDIVREMELEVTNAAAMTHRKHCAHAFTDGPRRKIRCEHCSTSNRFDPLENIWFRREMVSLSNWLCVKELGLLCGREEFIRDWLPKSWPLRQSRERLAELWTIGDVDGMTAIVSSMLITATLAFFRAKRVTSVGGLAGEKIVAAHEDEVITTTLNALLVMCGYPPECLQRPNGKAATPQRSPEDFSESDVVEALLSGATIPVRIRLA